MNSLTILNQLKEYWFNNKCEDKFRSILNDTSIDVSEKEITSLDYLRDTFNSFSEEHNYSKIDPIMIEVIMNWGILMYMQIKDKLESNETSI
jgi:hypothetical protein